MGDPFRACVREDLARLLSHWKTIEFWIKRAEQVNKKAVIPAINELRYASRQLFQAVKLFLNEEFSDGDKSVIRKRIIIAEQYLLNADHDVCDAIVGFFDENIEYLDKSYGISQITIFFHDYPKLRQIIKESSALISDSRHEYDNRKHNYEKLRDKHFPILLDSYEQLLDAEVSAKSAKEHLEYQLTIANAKIKILTIIGISGALASIIAIPLAIYLWVTGPQEFCRSHSQNFLFGGVCSLAATQSVPDATTPSANPNPSASTPHARP
jgi:hypothetical protein